MHSRASDGTDCASRNSEGNTNQEEKFMSDLRMNIGDTSVITFVEDQVIVANNPQDVSTTTEGVKTPNSGVVSASDVSHEVAAKNMASDPSGALGAKPINRFSEPTPVKLYSSDELEKEMKSKMQYIFSSFQLSSNSSIEVTISYKGGKPSELQVKCSNMSPEKRMEAASQIRRLILSYPVKAQNDFQFHRIYQST